MLAIYERDSKKVQLLYNQLWDRYGPQGWWPLFFSESPDGYHPSSYNLPLTNEGRFEVCLGAILTQNTSWENVMKALKNLSEAQLFQDHQIYNTTEETLMELIRPSGYFRQKAKKIKIFTQWWIENRINIPERRDLLNIWGIGPQTTDAILCYAYHQPIFVADTYAKRLFLSQGLIDLQNISYTNIQNIGQKVKPLKGQSQVTAYQEFHALIVEHGKRNLVLD